MGDDLVKRLRVMRTDYLSSAAANRIEELEDKLTVTWDTQTVKILVTCAYKEGWADGADNVPLGSGWEKSRTNATLTELKGRDDDG